MRQQACVEFRQSDENLDGASDAQGSCGVTLKADTSDALTLTGISKRAFDSDVFVGGASAEGPPEYMSVSFHTQMARQEHLYKLTEEGLIVGGTILFLQGNVLNIGVITCPLETISSLDGDYDVRIELAE